MRPPRRLAFVPLLIVPFALGALAAPRSSGILPGELLVPANVTSAFPACGQCHNPSPNANGPVDVRIDVPRSIASGATVPVRVDVTGGPGIGLAGFCLESSAGTLLAGSNTRTTAAGDAITHTDKFGNAWRFRYRSPAAAGPVRWTAVGQSVDASLDPTGDSWGFWGPDSSVPGVPLRLFTNAAGVVPFGRGCAGSGGHEPLLGAASPAALAGSFVTELHAVPPGVVAFCALGTRALTPPLDLAPVGAPGCLVVVDHRIVQRATTSGSGSGGGVAAFSWPIPNDPFLRGLTVTFQAYALDAGANAGGITATNGLAATVR